MNLALKIDVNTLRGTREGVPRLLELLQKHNAQATFLFSLGSDHTGRAIKRMFRPGFMKKASRTSVLEHYGYKTLMYGTLLPGPDIGKRCADVMRSVRDAGFEVGIHCYDHVRWQDAVAGQGAAWTAREMKRACDRFVEIFGEPARTYGAAGWQTNVHALRLEQRLGFDYCSDSRGSGPFIPMVNAEIIACPQLPTTLPTLDELIGRDGLTVENVAQYILQLTSTPAPDAPVPNWKSCGETPSTTRNSRTKSLPALLPLPSKPAAVGPSRSSMFSPRSRAWIMRSASPAGSEASATSGREVGDVSALN